MQNPFSWSYLNAQPYEMATWGPLSIAFVAVSGVGFIAALLIYYDVIKIARGNRLLRGPIQQAAGIASIILALGLIFFAFRIMNVSAFGLGKRLWQYLVVLAGLIEAAYYLYFLRVVYPPRARALAAERAKRRYLAPAVAGGSGSGRKRSKKKKR
ncbi:MAG TPA: hypothetical protein VFN57_00055 [Thermomicrobiaceae bacterium]|nr:hypothetical protein [Thermomicrobiaceae bacterium]